MKIILLQGRIIINQTGTRMVRTEEDQKGLRLTNLTKLANVFTLLDQLRCYFKLWFEAS